MCFFQKGSSLSQRITQALQTTFTRPSKATVKLHFPFVSEALRGQQIILGSSALPTELPWRA